VAERPRRRGAGADLHRPGGGRRQRGPGGGRRARHRHQGRHRRRGRGARRARLAGPAARAGHALGHRPGHGQRPRVRRRGAGRPAAGLGGRDLPLRRRAAAPARRPDAVRADRVRRARPGDVLGGAAAGHGDHGRRCRRRGRDGRAGPGRHRPARRPGQARARRCRRARLRRHGRRSLGADPGGSWTGNGHTEVGQRGPDGPPPGVTGERMSGYDDGRTYDERAYPQQPYDRRGYPGDPAAGPPSRVTVNAGRLWAAGVATALVCALIGLVGVLVVRAVFKVALFAPEEASAVGDIDTGLLCIAAAGAALVATGLVHLLLLSTPRPLSYFVWIVGLATLAAVVVPFLSVSPLSVAVAMAVIHLIIGLAIGTLISGAARAATRGPAGSAYDLH